MSPSPSVPAASGPLSAPDVVPPGAPARRRPRRVLRRLLVAALLAVLLVVGLVGAYGVHLARTFDQGRTAVAVDGLADAGDGAVNVLLLGSDTREEGDATTESGGRADTIMLLHIPADGGAPTVISILRDSYVDIPGYGESKVNAALSRGGLPLMVDTVEELLGVPIHHVAEVDFQGFEGLTDAVGGVEVENPQEFTVGTADPTTFAAGEIELDGAEALQYVRERHAFARGDLMRVQNQQRYITGLLDRITDPAVLLDPSRTTDAVSALAAYLTVDEDLTGAQIASLAWRLRGVADEDVQMLTVPVAGYATTDDGQSVVELDETDMQELRDALQTDALDAYAAEHADGASTG